MNKLTQEQKRVKIAEACEWKCHGLIGSKLLMWPPLHGDAEVPPDYFGDLNAMHEAERLVGLHEYGGKFSRKWSEVCESIASEFDGSIVYARQYLAMTAAHRAEAFGLALNLWKEGQ